ncbi:LCP family protein [Spirillospora sp. NPDC047279]|uniref:LCP family protein n=1 Tax=Spirillospora sp. NPDC047279 TaxID=3155478 RepID=UPI0033DD8BE3
MDDDLDLIRDLGRDLDRDLGRDLGHGPPATLVRQRRRLTEAATGAGAGRASSRGVRPRGRLLIGVVAAVTAALILVPTALLGREKGGTPATGGDSTGPASAARALNVLVLGSDTRGGAVEARSDTIVLLHLPADRKKITAVSVPRDVMTTLPACRTASGQTAPRSTGLINSAFTIGGLSCATKAVELLTRVRIDATLAIDFGGFKHMVNALGGVEVVLPRAVNDPGSGLRLAAGRHLIRGDMALAYVRVRHGLGDGSDLDRIERQQRFMAAMVRRAKNLQTTSPLRLAAFIKAAAASIDTAGPLDLGTMQDLARSLERTGPGAVRFATLPVRPHPTDPNRLAINEASAGRLLAPFNK